jgi:predicted nucleic acid-binding Zn ribbon protein
MRPLSHAVPGAIVELLRAAPLSPGKIAFAWQAVVGPAIGRATSVRLEGGTLLVDASSAAWGREVTRASHVILPRLQALLGQQAVRAITVRR